MLIISHLTRMRRNAV